ncbi:hypothetical protein Egran_05693 [Elaphomyces granulatus]|uniref:SEC7 domain-containing protein n=1 Tax=Elaphomyces granulatus TaxID=519963 RepID=A0A232LQX7_9EURO|nr:hypothetical protein Egran_05693 [Elaphomyces granulatus]
MPWKALRLSPFNSSDGNGSKKSNAIFSAVHARHSEHVPRPILPTSQHARRRSDSGPRPRIPESNGLQPATLDDDPTETPEETASNGNIETSILMERRQSVLMNRFSVLRFRHASDPQLSTTFAQADGNTPPLPPMPPPPTIITTAPTSRSIDPPKRKKFQFVSSHEKATSQPWDSNTESRTGSRSGASPKLSPSRKPASPEFGPSVPGQEESGRLSTSSWRHVDEFPHPSEPDARFSESSRSDRSSADRGLYLNGAKGNGAHPNKGFRLPRLKRNRGPLFPLPVKVPPPVSVNSPSVNETHSPCSASNDADGLVSVDRQIQDRDHLSPLPSPSHSSTGVSSTRAGPSVPALFRKDSAKSVHSAHSLSSAHGQRSRGGRGRSSTISSLVDIQGDQQQSSTNLASLTQAPTSTSGRKSFGDIFNLRFRQNSEASTLRNGCSPRTPTLASKSGSSRDAISYPEREDSDTPATYLTRLGEVVHRGLIATILSKPDEDFYKTALRKYLRGFSFFGDPIDMAIRKLLMQVELPKETQQIDRVLQSFADRYHECNPGIFASAGKLIGPSGIPHGYNNKANRILTDQTYFIAFSILILHTDVFNKNNKRKMQKQDYVKNTKGEGISEDILECIYDNISYTPFIHVEDELNLSGRHLAKPRKPLFKTASSDHLTRTSREPVDPYALILEGKLDILRPTLRDVMNLDDTYSCTGTTGPPDIEGLHQAFIKSSILQIVSARSRPDAFRTPSSIDNPAESHPGLVDIKVAKVGLLWRKDPKKKRARSPWQEWGALLTFSQLYFFRDVNWAKSLMAQHDSHHQNLGRRHPVVFAPPLTEFKPDAIMPTLDAVALLDSNYKKHKHAFLFVRHHGLEEVFLANSEVDMNDWLSKLNFAATFRTTGVRMTGIVGTGYESRHRHISHIDSSTSDGSSHADDARTITHENVDPHLAEQVSTARRHLMEQRIKEADETLSRHGKGLDDILRNARHLQVLTPVNNRAREHVILAAGRMAATLKWVRLDMWRTRCYREILSLDLDQEEKQGIRSNGSPSVTSSTKADVSAPKQDSASNVTHTMNGDDPHTPSRPLSPNDLSPQMSPLSQWKTSTSVSAHSSELTPKGRQPSIPDPNDSPSSPNRGVAIPSVLSFSGKMEASSSAIPDSKVTSPVDVDDGEEQVLREAGLLGVDGATNALRQPDVVHDAEHGKPADEPQTPATAEHRNRSRRSLQRSLRDPHHGLHHQRSKKGRDSVSSIPSADDVQGGNQGEILARKQSSFTFHGKKASVISFSSEWQNMPPEERLKLRKATPAEESKASDHQTTGDGSDSIRSESVTGGRPQSVRSASRASAGSGRNHESLPLASEIPELPPLSELKRELEAAAANNVDEKLGIWSDALASPPLVSSSFETEEIPTKVIHSHTESDPLSKAEDSVDDSASQGTIRHNPPEQAVGA